jgi:inner membrane transporter RhtA
MARTADIAVRPPAARTTLAARLRGVPPPMLFVTGAISQYAGAACAVLLFKSVDAAGVAWLRVLAAAAVLLAWRRPWQVAWSRGRLALAAAFGVVIAAMNVTFYLSIARIPLGTAVAIEFIGPVAVAALGSRTRRDVGALGIAAAGIALLADVRISGSAAGVGFALAAGVLWSAYIVLGHRVASATELRQHDGLATAMAVGALAFAPFVGPIAGPAFESPGLLIACLAVGVFSSVVPYGLEQIAMRRLPRPRFALLLALLPATAALMGGIVLGQVPRPGEAVGIALVVLATALGSHAE